MPWPCCRGTNCYDPCGCTKRNSTLCCSKNNVLANQYPFPGDSLYVVLAEIADEGPKAAANAAGGAAAGAPVILQYQTYVLGQDAANQLDSLNRAFVC